MPTPFDGDRLDELMAGLGIDVVLASAKFNVQYLLGGYRFFFFENMDAIGVSRYLPFVGYVARRPDAAFYIGAGNEAWGTDAFDIWIDDVRNVSWSSLESAEAAAAALTERGLATGTIAVEYSFIPADALDRLRTLLPDATFVDAHLTLEALRGRKSPAEQEIMASASEKIIESMLATFAAVEPGMTKRQIVERFRQEQTRIGMVFDYCLAAVGPSLNRAPSDEVWQPGTVLSLDSGGMLGGYIGDLARMAVHGSPTPRMVDLMDQIENIQQLARTAIRPGALGKDVFTTVADELAASKDAAQLRFVTHGMGLISHEVPRLTSTGPVPYPADHADVPLEPGNVLSVETWVEDAEIGFIKLEDTLIVTEDGYVAPGDWGRGFNVV